MSTLAVRTTSNTADVVARLCCHALLSLAFPFPSDNRKHGAHRRLLDRWLNVAKISIQPSRVDPRSSSVRCINVQRLYSILSGSNGPLNPTDVQCVRLDSGEVMFCIDNVCIGVDGEQFRIEICLPSL